MSIADRIFIQNCCDILNEGHSSHNENVRAKWSDGTPAHTFKKFGIINRYDLSQEFPILTLRPTPFKTCIREILWIHQKHSNLIKDLDSTIWDEWALEDGSIGTAYGYVTGLKHKYPQGEMTQIDNVIYNLKNNPNDRRMIISMYSPHLLHTKALMECCYSITFNVANGKLNAILSQRSQDFLVANSFNITQYAVLVHMLAQVSNLQVGKLVHVIADAHIYDRHIPLVEELIRRDEYPAPKLKINPDIKNFYDFKVEDFILENYKAGEQIKNIPVAI